MKIEIYSKPNCTFCDRTKFTFDVIHQKYIEYVLEKDFTKEQFIEKFGQSTFPRIIINDELIGGFSELQSIIVENKLETYFNPKTI